MELTYEMFVGMTNIARSVHAELRGERIEDEDPLNRPMTRRAQMRLLTDAYLNDPGYDLTRRHAR